MNRRYEGLSVLLPILGLCLLLGLTACSDDEDDIVTPGGEDETTLAVSPDSLASLLQGALADADAMMLPALLADDFRYQLDYATWAGNELPTHYLNGYEFQAAAGAMFAGQSVADNVMGVVWNPIASVEVEVFEPLTAWTEASQFSHYPGAQTATFNVRIRLQATIGLLCEHTMMLYATPSDTTLGDGTEAQVWRLARIVDVMPIDPSAAASDKSIEPVAFGAALCLHLAPGAPTPELTLSDAGGFPQPVVACDASGSSDPLHGLAEEAFRFLETGLDPWESDWQDSPQFERALGTVGVHTIRLEVANRWGIVGSVERTVGLSLGEPPAATTREQLMQNFSDAYGKMLAAPLVSQLDPRFKVMLLESTRTTFGFPGDSFSAAQFDSIHTRMFRGDAGRDADGNVVEPVASIWVSLFEQQADWADVPANDPDFGEYGGVRAPYYVTVSFYNASRTHRFQIQQIISFYVVEVEEAGETVYRLVGMRALSTGAKSEEAAWDAVMALFL